ncbi:MAG TPA: TetR/AcrR family transcriptional regulator [Ghiorsea sp.]|nr:TetR/AcrR family transcriptional regulator [Ghiorsea sp.]
MQQRHANLRKLAISTAESRIAECGIQGLKARFVAKEIGCSVGTLYNLFKNIDFLIFAVNLKTLSALETLLKHASTSSTTGAQALRSITNTYINFTLSNPNLWLTLFEHQFTNPDDTPQDYYQLRINLFHILEAQVADIHPNLSAHDIALESRALWAGVHGICMLNITNKLDDDGYTLNDIATTLISKFVGERKEATP